VKRVYVLMLIALLLALAACTGTSPKVGTQTTPVFNSPSPMPTPTLSSPLDASALKQGPAFAFSEPVKAGDTVIKGTGGSNVPIRIVSISDAGDIVASGIVGSDGKFSFSVDAQLVKGTRLGIILGETAGTNFKQEDFVSGPNYSDLPYIGVVFADTLVQ
jgi:hypothetical protein